MPNESDSRVARAVLPPPLVRAARWLVPLIYVACLFGFIFDLTRSDTLAYGIVYTPMVATAVFHRSRRAAWVLAGVAITAVVIGAFIPYVDPDLLDLIGNRVLSILAIIFTAIFMNYARTIRERLEVETRRAEAAERIKGQVLSNLTEEMHTPLHGLLGLMGLLKASARPDQQSALESVQVSAHRLLRTIDNLIDLTQLEDRALTCEPVDLTEVAQEIAEEAADLAREHEIDIRVASGRAPVSRPGVAAESVVSRDSVVGDSWAIRRIIGNLVAYKISQARPGETVSIIVKRNGGDIAASVAGPVPANLAEASGDGLGAECEDAWWVASGAALALCHRLARGMNGRLLVAEPADDEAMFTLSLPAA